MKKRQLFVVGLGILLVVALATRAFGPKPGVFVVTESQADGDQMATEFRMSQPFEVSLEHGVRTAMVWPKGPGIHVGSYTPLRTENAELIASKYDILRGDYYVRLRLQRGQVLTVDANGRHLELAAWLAPDARNVQWTPSGTNIEFGDGVGVDLLLFDKTVKQEEYLMLYAGTDLKHGAK